MSHIRILAAMAVMVAPLPAMAQAVSSATFVKKAGASDLYEKDSSKLVLQTSKNAKLRDFANMMIKDHTTSTAEVKAAAMKAGMHPAPPMLDAAQQGMIAKLRAAKGTARDTLYVDQQKGAHQMALTLMQGYAANGTSAPLKGAAGKIAPVVQGHIDALNAM